MSVNESVPVRAPELVGRNAIEISHEAPIARAAGATGHVVADWMKFALRFIEDITRGNAPAGLVLVTVTCFTPDVLPTFTLCQKMDEGDRDTVGRALNDTPHPDRRPILVRQAAAHDVMILSPAGNGLLANPSRPGLTADLVVRF